MTKPDDIPQDVWQEAETALFDGSSNIMKIIEAVARAIMAERARCATTYREGAGPDTWDYFREAEDAISKP